MNPDVKFICLQDDAFYKLIEEVVERIRKAENLRSEDKWISTEEAMDKLRIKSKTSLQQLRDRELIKFTQPKPKIILYDSESIDEYLEKFAHKTK